MSYSRSNDNTSDLGSYSRESSRVSVVSTPWLRYRSVDNSDIDVVMDSVETTDDYKPMDAGLPVLDLSEASPSLSGEHSNDLSNCITEVSRRLFTLQSAVQGLNIEASSYAASAHRLGYIRDTLEGTSWFLYELNRVQESLYNLEKQDHVQLLDRSNITKLLRQSRVTQLYLQSLEIASLDAITVRKSAGGSQARECKDFTCLVKDIWRGWARSYPSQLPVPPEWAGALCDHPCCCRLAS